MNTFTEAHENVISLQARIVVLEGVLRDTYLTLRDATTEEKLFKACRDISANIEGLMPEWTARVNTMCRPTQSNGLHKFRCDVCKTTFQSSDDIDTHHGSVCGCSEGGSYGLVLEEEI